MASNAELALISKILKLEGIKVRNYSLIEEIGIFIYIESQHKKVVCPHCDIKTDKLHENYECTVRDLPLGEQAVYLKVNRRRFNCTQCNYRFSEEFQWLKKNKTYTERLKEKIVREVLENEITNVANRYGVSEQQIKTMLKEFS